MTMAFYYWNYEEIEYVSQSIKSELKHSAELSPDKSGF